MILTKEQKFVIFIEKYGGIIQIRDICEIMINNVPKISQKGIYLKQKEISHIQSAVKAFGSAHPSAQEPLNASQCRFLHFSGHVFVQPTPYLFWSQPEGK